MSCSIAKRSHDDCRQDILPGTDALQSEVRTDGGRARVRAWVEGLGGRTAVHLGKTGCVLQ